MTSAMLALNSAQVRLADLHHCVRPLQSREVPSRGEMIEVHQENQWITFTTSAASAPVVSGAGNLGVNGLWKAITEGSSACLVFELPMAVCQAIREEEDLWAAPGVCPQSIIDWAKASLHNELPRNWRAPDRELAESWVPPASLTLQLGPILIHGELILTGSRWALRFPLAPRLPADLPEDRLCCLRELAMHAQHYWRMVRVGLEPQPSGTAFIAEVDLSGAPCSETLLLAALDGLRHVARWLAEPVQLLADTTVTLRSPEVWQSKTKNKKGTRRDGHLNRHIANRRALTAR
jgi:hypothetical protein